MQMFAKQNNRVLRIFEADTVEENESGINVSFIYKAKFYKNTSNFVLG